MAVCWRSSIGRGLRIGGFTLIELVMVIAIVAVIGGLASMRFGAVVSWKQRTAVRQFTNIWQHLYGQAMGRGDAFRLVIDLDNNSYFVRREIPITGTYTKQVDYLKNLRTRREKERRANEEMDESLNLKEEFEAEDVRDASQLDRLFYQSIFDDPYGSHRLGPPLEDPSLAQPQKLSEGLKFRDVKIQNKVFDKGQVFIRLSTRGASEFAVVHFEAGEGVITVMMNPATGSMIVENDDVDFAWTLGQDKKRSSR